jgi:hypothetical protein
MAQAAQALRAAAQHTGQQQQGEAPGSEPGLASRAERDIAQPDSPVKDPQARAAGKGALDLAELKARVRSKTGRTWGELPGHLRTEILQMSQGRYRDDYARLIQLYFREIAAGAEQLQP